MSDPVATQKPPETITENRQKFIINGT